MHVNEIVNEHLPACIGQYKLQPMWTVCANYFVYYNSDQEVTLTFLT